MCSKIMSIEDPTDLMELFEYDEFDSYDDQTYLFTDNFNQSGVPLSVELSESLSKNQTPVTEKPSTGFVKAPEIFLRIESSGTEAFKTDTNSESLSENRDTHKNALNKLRNCGKSNSFESNESNDVILVSNQDECAELQYENEFVGPNDGPDCELVQSGPKRHNSIENDYEELLFEGINKHFAIRNIYMHNFHQ